ncbi:Uu.00g141260.m01.CDS01 [Anthostomella pinea]|uniref:Uu.00g141260.m01.CDS01 n=1 Tax=Anthostomella pinea TaxID=933095 RepID=A0AAI8VJT0_9PEZI|nr:Uu.00g141260.m01.CDS01 [Anthostomella pinea]
MTLRHHHMRNNDEVAETFNWTAVMPPPSARFAVLEALTNELQSAIPSIARPAVLGVFDETSL